MITYLTGDILFSKCQTLVNPALQKKIPWDV